VEFVGKRNGSPSCGTLGPSPRIGGSDST
jgi:hypothetical protein